MRSASLLLGLALLLAAAGQSLGKTKTKTYNGAMLGRYYNDPKVIGFDGKKFTYDHLGILPQTINIAAYRTWRLFGVLKKGHSPGTSALGKVFFQRNDLVEVEVRGDRLSVKLNYKNFQPSSVKITGKGRLTYEPFEWGKDRVVIIQQSSMVIRIVQPYSATLTKYMRWLDVYVTVTRPPNLNLWGILGKTLPRV